MSFTSWFPVSRLHGDSALSKRDRQARRQPIHSRPSLESLEERTMLDASGQLGGDNNLVFNGAAASSGNVLPIPTSGYNVVADSGTSAQAAASAFLDQDQLYAQFRLFGVNSQGNNSQSGQQSTANILRDAYGFGSGSQPNAPWKPNAYNLGLANHQFGYSTQTDNGFPSVPPWSTPTAQSLPKDQNPLLDQDQAPASNKDEKETEASQQLATHWLIQEQDEAQQHDRLDQDFADKSDELKALMEQQASEKKAPVEAAAPADSGIPDEVLLSTLAPAQMAALVVGLPGMPGSAEGGEAAAESGDAVEAAPE